MSDLLQVRDLHVTFVTPDRTVHAVNGVSFDVERGETLGILGESGSGKSVTLRSILRLHPEHRTRWSGSIRMEGDEVLDMGPRALGDLRGQRVAMIFQEPATAFDPVFTIGHQIAETVQRHTGKSEADACKRARELLEMVRIPSPAQRLKAYPHEMSGGMRQRAMIALALSCNPSLLLADEPTTALDATVQIQVLLLIRELQREFDLGVIFVTHDIGVAVEVSDRIGVMYAGKIVELAPVEQMVDAPQHPYSRGLLASTVHDGMRGQRLEAIPGAPPDLGEVPTGCSFAPRCKFVRPDCIDCAAAIFGRRAKAIWCAACWRLRSLLGARHPVRSWATSSTKMRTLELRAQPRLAEHLLHLAEEAFGFGAGLAGLLEFLEQLLLLGGEVGRRLDVDLDVHVAALARAHDRHALAAQAELVAALGAGRDVDARHLAVERRHLDVAAERRLHHRRSARGNGRRRPRARTAGGGAPRGTRRGRPPARRACRPRLRRTAGCACRPRRRPGC